MGKHNKHTVLKVILALLVLLATGLLIWRIIVYLCRPKRMSAPVATQFGPVVGVEGDDNTFAWFGIPFAKPPTLENKLRWKVPVDPDPWKENLDLPIYIKDVPAPAQQGLIIHDLVGSEDCLYINVWRPRNATGPLPVYAWIFGGGNNVGATWKYPGSRIANTSNVVFVSIQYRLGAFGWLQYEGMDKSTPEQASGNFGTLDIFKGLTWIQKNISNFGGDPTNVLLSGESAGAYNCLCAMLSPLARGLFHKVLYESGGMYLRTKEEAIATGVRLNANLPVSKKSLEGSSTEEIVKAFFLTPPRYSGAFRDGYVIPDATIPAIISSGTYNKVPIMLGTNLNETKYLCIEIAEKIKNAYKDPTTGLKTPIPTGKYTYANIPAFMYFIPYPSLDSILPTQADKDMYNAGNELSSLMWNIANSDDLATAFSKNVDQDVYVYQYIRQGEPGSDYALGYGACHASEITYFFGYPEAILSPLGFHDLRSSLGFWGETDGAKSLCKTMMAYASNFLRTGNPNKAWLSPVVFAHEKADLPTWSKWTNASPQRLSLDATENTAVCKMALGSQTVADVTTLKTSLEAKYGQGYAFDTFQTMVEIDLTEWQADLS